MPSVAIITDDPGWHGAVLTRTLEARGFECRTLSLTACRFDLNRPKPVVMPGFERELPTGVFIRGVPGGTLEQVILRLDLLHALRDLGIVVYNDGRAIERTVDKAMTSFLLKRAGVPTPDTWVLETESEARALVESELARNIPLVMKPLFGSQGAGVILVDRSEALPSAEDYGQVYYLQRYIDSRDSEWRDWRVLVIGGQAVAVMQRRSSHWITNRARGGRCLAVDLDAPLAMLAEEAARAVVIDYAGVDLMQDHDGRFLVTEVNSVPAWQGLQGVTRFDIAERLADHFLSRFDAARPRPAIA
ncbi:MAG: ATP-grasp domain-containing protein [Gammaproteobacteria bacterium]